MKKKGYLGYCFLVLLVLLLIANSYSVFAGCYNQELPSCKAAAKSDCEMLCESQGGCLSYPWVGAECNFSICTHWYEIHCKEGYWGEIYVDFCGMCPIK